ncbi:MAG: DUF72 domain-containing protein [Gammaproteobacteria bacterium]|nr:DUF72 domain-containing protein [Gammaproteobacteria bacterium]
MTFFVGTSGFSYKEWKGVFYPDKIKDKEMLAYYASQLSAVEINNTFYRMPKREVLRGWAEATPEDFSFIIKASRRITHFKRLKEADETMGYLMGNTAELGSKLGALLFQLPPNMRCNLERLKPFLDLIPEEIPATFEFRHPSWFDDSVFEVLKARNIPICHADSEDSELPFVVTADWGYLRLRKPGYDKRALNKWLKEIARAGWKDAHVFFKHEDAGAGPKMALKFLSLVGEEPQRFLNEKLNGS